MTAPMDTAREIAARRRDALAQMHDWPPEAREALWRALRPLLVDQHDGVGTDALTDAALAALAPFVAQIKTAVFERGAEAMRESAADLARLHVVVSAPSIRALPIPEDKQP